MYIYIYISQHTFPFFFLHAPGFFDFCRRQKSGKDVSFQIVADIDAVNAFLHYLKEERGCQPGTIMNYCTCLSRAVRYLQATKGDNPANKEMLTVLSKYNAECFRMAEQTRESSCEVLKSKGKWLSW